MRESFIDLDYEQLDEFGLPRARRHWKLSEIDMKLHNDMKERCKEILTGKPGADSFGEYGPIH